MIDFQYNTKMGVLETTYAGQITLEHVIGYIDATRENISYPRKLKIVSNALAAYFNFSVDDLGAIVKANSLSLEQYDLIIDAIVIDSPYEAALTILYQELAKNRKYRFKIFTTLRGANLWLKDQ